MWFGEGLKAWAAILRQHESL